MKFPVDVEGIPKGEVGGACISLGSEDKLSVEILSASEHETFSWKRWKRIFIGPDIWKLGTSFLLS